MDLYAYAQISELDSIAKKNGIEIPRLRGYRLMKEEDIIPQEEINKMKKRAAIEMVEHLCGTEPFWSSDPYASVMFSDFTDYYRDFYLVKGKDENGNIGYIDIRWDRIHGWKRKRLKFMIKKKNRKIQAQMDMFNKYVGKNVLYIHSRMGGYNWEQYTEKDSIVKQPWFLDRVDDYWDGTYCDFYARLDC